MAEFELGGVEDLILSHLTTVMTFGKYKGEKISEIVEYDPEYIIWLYDEGILKPDAELLKQIHNTKTKPREEEQDDGFNDWDDLNKLFDRRDNE